ncbi:MAG: RidA family protein [Oscillospiraceae bacterium]
MKKIVNSAKAPAAIGPYSQAVKADKFIFVSGQLPINVETGEFSGQDIASQTKQSIENIKVILESEGYSLEDIVKTTVFLDKISDFAPMNAVYGEYFKKDCPARAAFEVGNLPKSALVEIEAVAYKD